MNRMVRAKESFTTKKGIGIQKDELLFQDEEGNVYKRHFVCQKYSDWHKKYIDEMLPGGKYE